MTKKLNELGIMIDILPAHFHTALVKRNDLDELVEIVLDYGSPLTLKLQDEVLRFANEKRVTKADIKEVVAKCGQFNANRRAGIDGTLHRISSLENRQGELIGLTLRIGRHIEGCIDPIRDILETGQNILLLGPPGRGKTTKLREMARILSTDMNRHVMIVDTSNEIAGEGDIPHSGVGYSRRMQVANSFEQAAAMIEAVENHMPEVIVVDEIGTEEKALAARSIAERGVQLLASAHGHTIENIIKNPTISDLLGGIQAVILGDEEAKLRNSSKTILERKNLPTFGVLVELYDLNSFGVYDDTKSAVDDYLRGIPVHPLIRGNPPAHDMSPTVEVMPSVMPQFDTPSIADGDKTVTKIFPVGINVGRLHAAIDGLNVSAAVSHSVGNADIVLTTKSHAKSKSKVQQILSGREIPLHVIKRNVMSHILGFLRYYFELSESDEDLEMDSDLEIKDVCEEVLSKGESIEASPRNAYLRRRQHQIVSEFGLNSMSVGEEPSRRVRVYPK